MEFRPETIANAHARMAQIKAYADGSFSTNYFRQEVIGQQVLVTTTDQRILRGNDGARQSGPTDCDSRDLVWTWSVAKSVCQGAQTDSRDSRSRTR